MPIVVGDLKANVERSPQALSGLPIVVVNMPIIHSI